MIKIWNESKALEDDNIPYGLRLSDEYGADCIVLQVVNRKGERIPYGNVLFIEEEHGMMFMKLAGALTNTAGFEQDDTGRVVVRH